MTDSTADRPSREATDLTRRAGEHDVAAPGGAVPDAPGARPPRCLHCDYILLGLPGDRCPECGTRIDWEAVSCAAAPPLPIERAQGRRRWWGAVRTWLLIAFRPRAAARSISEETSTRWATVFALGCIVLGIGGNAIADDFNPASMVGWAVAVWFHVECQSALFVLLEFPGQAWRRRWAMWRKVSMYTTAFVVLDLPRGPPMLDMLLTTANFPWPLESEMWQLGKWWPPQQIDPAELLRGVAYYWWMIVLVTIVWVRLRRKWVLLWIVAALPWVSAVSCQVGANVAQALGAY